MKNLLFATLLLAAACGPARNIFHKDDTPREAYERRLDKQGLDETPAFRAWKAAAATALQQPLAVPLPYLQSGQFPADKPRALALRIPAKMGQRLQVMINHSGSAPIYAELFDEKGSLLFSADTAASSFTFNATAAGDYILRLQPPLGADSRYKLSLRTEASLLFPVAGAKAKTGSFWGADRDGGARRHEGVDIFAAKGTAALAAADGTVTRVAEGGLGGKYVFLQPDGKDYSLYYAHLDKQLVQAGQHVKAGETLGLVGNTGNASTTPPHLHFGVYTGTGAVDPFPFIDRNETAAAALPDKELPAMLKVKKGGQKSAPGIAANMLLTPLGWTAKGWLVELPDGRPTLVPFAAVSATSRNS